MKVTSSGGSQKHKQEMTEGEMESELGKIISDFGMPQGEPPPNFKDSFAYAEELKRKMKIIN